MIRPAVTRDEHDEQVLVTRPGAVARRNLLSPAIAPTRHPPLSPAVRGDIGRHTPNRRADGRARLAAAAVDGVGALEGTAGSAQAVDHHRRRGCRRLLPRARAGPPLLMRPSVYFAARRRRGAARWCACPCRGRASVFRECERTDLHTRVVRRSSLLTLLWRTGRGGMRGVRKIPEDRASHKLRCRLRAKTY